MIERLESLVSNKIENYENACYELQSAIEIYIKQILALDDCNELELSNKNIFTIRMYFSYIDDYEDCEVKSVRFTNQYVEVLIGSVWHKLQDLEIYQLQKLYYSLKEEMKYINII